MKSVNWNYKLDANKHIQIMKYTLSILSVFFSLSSIAQDIVIKNDGSELKVKVTSISETELKYQKDGLAVDFTMNLSNVLMVTFENGERMTFQNVKKKDDSIILSAGTRIPLEISETISSDDKGGRRVGVGDIINLTVQYDISDTNGNTLVTQWTLVTWRINKSERRKAAGTKGKLGFTVSFVKAIDGQSVPVNLQYDSEGKSRTNAAVAGALVVAAPLLLVKGKPAIIEAGTVFEAMVVGDKKIQVE